MKNGKPPLIILTGPTSVGKTKLSIQLAKEIGGEIISADSMQVYRYMDIGSAKIKEEEKEGVTHYLIDVLDPKEEFNIVLFKQMADAALKQIYEKGKIPIIAGGTGFYIQAVIYDIDFTAHDDESSLRRELETIAQTQNGAHVLHERLQLIDPASADIIHENNVKRVIRAIEFYEETGKRISEHNEEQHQKDSPYHVMYFVLNDERELIYDRINRRVDQMVEEGLLSEVQMLKDMGCTRDMVSMQGLGYKEMLDYLDGKITLEEALYRIKRDTRHFAKRQITWFKRERDVIWLDRSEYRARVKKDILHMSQQDINNRIEEQILCTMLKEIKSHECISHV